MTEGGINSLTAPVILTAACAVFCPCQNNHRGAGPSRGWFGYGWARRSFPPVTGQKTGFHIPFPNMGPI